MILASNAIKRTAVTAGFLRWTAWPWWWSTVSSGISYATIGTLTLKTTYAIDASCWRRVCKANVEVQSSTFITIYACTVTIITAVTAGFLRWTAWHWWWSITVW